MNIKKITAIGVMAFTLIAPVLLTGCVEKTEKLEVQKEIVPAPVVIQDRKVDVNVHTDAPKAPIIIHKDTSTNTTIEKDSDTGVKTETKTESTTIH